MAYLPAIDETAIALFKVFMPATVMPELQQTLFSGYIGEGPRTVQFETELAQWLGVPHVVSLNSGTSALHLAMRLAGIGPGCEVITTPLTCLATNTPIAALGARPVWADIDPESGNICPAAVARLCNANTKAIVAVHWGGYPCDLDELAAVARRWSIPLIQDASHALGARYKDRCIGQDADFACFSFQAIKLLTTGDGGALVCGSAAAAERARRLRWFGLDRRLPAGDCRWEQDVGEHGYKFQMNDIAATIGLQQLRHVDANLARHREHAAAYDEALRHCRQIRPLRREADRESAFWLYTVRVRDRSAFVEHMRAAGIETSRVHVRNDGYGMFAGVARTALPGVDRFDAEQVCIPCGWWLSPRDVERVIAAALRYEALR